jgi:hypothetical protein
MRGISDWQKFEGPTFELHTIVFNNGALSCMVYDPYHDRYTDKE